MNEIRNLKKRYLLWLYKTTKEAWDKIERKFTQLEIDRFLLKELGKNKDAKLKPFLEDFKVYIRNKEKEGQVLKYSGKVLKPDYYFLGLKLKAIEKAIVKVLGRATLKEIKALYDKEMTERILKSREQK